MQFGVFFSLRTDSKITLLTFKSVEVFVVRKYFKTVSKESHPELDEGVITGIDRKNFVTVFFRAQGRIA